MESFGQSSEPIGADQRRDLVSRFVKDVSEGNLSLSLDYKGRRYEDVQMISDILGRLINHLNDYVLGVKAGEEQDFLERQLFFCISVLRSFDGFKTNLNRSKLEESIEKMESKLESMNSALSEVLTTLKSSPPPRKTTTRRRTTKSTAKKEEAATTTAP